VQTAAIRALSDWPDSGPLNDLRLVAKNSDNQVHRVLALRGFVRLIGLKSERTAEETIKLYREAMELAPNVQERKSVLSGLGRVRTLEALQMAYGYTKDASLSQEASAAVVDISDAISGMHPSQCKTMLDKVLAISTNASVRQRAQGIIERIEMFGDYIVDWQVSQRYEQKDTGPTEVFDVVCPKV
jgi:hypothetical protein